ncbi:pentapeptide repeat-containing protein [Amycolatopsis sp. WQ 127309]|uniref:pentapeptide repeat-containing protein n=1 Tax=Amycolatopsis sp. WQ 127309 TaxID=2932773 RepID=UPI001FF4E891|nr:pentapeptide repeat-containing protein [Amycolatopsis sp. WQ 127309]UOZ09016.1 pentapeptide repeat-containing protein [Amycolatopsis sp. WQ 127309]
MTNWKPTLPRLSELSWAPARGALVLSGAALLAGMTVLFGWIDWLALGQWARPHAVPIALFAAAGIGVTAAGWRLRGQRAPRTRASGMSWWVVVGAAIVVVVVAWVATNWLLGEAAAAKDPGAARVDAIKTGLGIGAGTTGIFALLLAVRRQWHSESDAIEKNVTELYAKAADQLGSAEAPVRLAGLYALERLAHNNPGQRQSIVNVICAYLRMPYTPPGAALTTDSVEHQERTQEREVRLAFQRILTDHLDPENLRSFWNDLDLDLSNAHLVAFTLENCRTRDVRFDGTTFTGYTSFDGATFTANASFDGATFTHIAWFTGATFTANASFDGATFTHSALFNRATFSGSTWFGKTYFADGASFDDATFTGITLFSSATFTGFLLNSMALATGASFDNANFSAVASFDNTNFSTGASFDGVTFTTGVSFSNAAFTGNTSFDNANFITGASFDGATFTDDVSFSDATFTGGVSFNEATFTGALPTIDRRLAGKVAFTNVILTTYLPDRTSIAGIIVDMHEVREANGETEASWE